MVKITAEMIKNAETYIPLIEKAKLAEDISRKCVKVVEFAYTPTDGGETIPMPPGAQEVPFLTNLCLMGVLVSRYFKQGEDWADDVQMPLNVYDEWAGSHVMNQLERLKGNKAVADRVYDLLYDYRDFRWMVRQSVESRVAQGSDIVSRMHQMLSLSAMDVSPEMLEKTMEELESFQQKHQGKGDDA